jgi:agmatinase
LNVGADASARFLALGGEHSISCLFIEQALARFPDLVLLHLDAHADLRDGYQGFHYSHAAAIRRCLDHFGPGHRLAQFGIRSGTREEFHWMRDQRTLYRYLSEFINQIEKIPEERPIYLTLDLDYFDPAFLPGTGTPEAGGEDFHSFIEIIRALKDKKLVGGDVVELAPALDPTGNSEVFGAKVVRELILACHGEDGHVA